MQNNSSMVVKSDGSWRGWFHSLAVNKFLCFVPNSFINDPFNISGLELRVENLMGNLDAILDNDFDTAYGFNPLDVDPEPIALLYGLLHARYILTPLGIQAMCQKYKNGEFGMCPRVYCNGQHVLPVGQSEMFGDSHVKVFCPRCQDVYQPQTDCLMLDGAMFGRTFPHMFFMQLPEMMPEPPTEKYTPRLFGFRLHESALMPTSSSSSSSSSDISMNMGKNENNLPKKKDSPKLETSPKPLDLSLSSLLYSPL